MMTPGLYFDPVVHSGLKARPTGMEAQLYELYELYELGDSHGLLLTM